MGKLLDAENLEDRGLSGAPPPVVLEKFAIDLAVDGAHEDFGPAECSDLPPLMHRNLVSQKP
jgi:hypothetical protein